MKVIPLAFSDRLVKFVAEVLDLPRSHFHEFLEARIHFVVVFFVMERETWMYGVELHLCSTCER